MAAEPVRTLGVDPGTAIMGYGVVERVGSSLRALEFGALTTPSAEPMPRRLLSLYTRLTALIDAHRPGALAVEELFFNRNVRTAIPVGQARGIVLLSAAQANVPVFEYTPLQVKDAVVGYGRATKDQVQQMIRTLLDLDVVPRPDDAADALAIAICHMHSVRLGALVIRPGSP
jgi:crossover junction endodeoxyribonuclease RuvC